MIYKRNCKWCQVSKGNNPLRQRIRHAAFEREDGDESLQQIAGDLAMNTATLYNHVKRHLRDSTERKVVLREVSVARKTALVQAEAFKDIEEAITETSDITVRPEQIIALDQYIAQGADMVKKGQLKITANSFLAAVKIKNDWEKGQTANKIDLIKTVYAFAGAKRDRYSSGTTDSPA